MLLVIDNQSSYIKKFKRQFLSEQDFDFIFFDHNQPITLSFKSEIKGIILSGGRGDPYAPLNLTSNFVAINNFDVPILGFCLGHEILAIYHYGRIKKLQEPHRKKEEIEILDMDDPIFQGLTSNKFKIQKRHSYYVSELPKDFISLAKSSTCKTEIIRHKDKPIYGFQGHPEVSAGEGITMIKNFIKICNMNLEEWYESSYNLQWR